MSHNIPVYAKLRGTACNIISILPSQELSSNLGESRAEWRTAYTVLIDPSE